MMSTPPPASPDPGSVWPPPPTQVANAAPARRAFVSLRPLARAIATLAALDLAGYMAVMLVRSHRLPSAGLLTDALVTIFSGLIYLGSFVAYRIVFLRWTFLAYRNLEAFQAAGLETTPGWAVGWFFVPIVNAYRPYLIFHELWKAGTPGVDSRDEIAWQRVPSPPLIGWWWASLLVYLVFPSMLSKVLTHGLTEVAQTILEIALAIVSMGLTITLVGVISRRQEAKAREIAPAYPTYL